MTSTPAGRFAPDRAELARRFTAFATETCAGYSPLYERLASAVAQDAEVLDLLAAARPGQRRPVLLFAAVQYLLLSGEEHALAGHYPSVATARGIGVSRGDAWPPFRDFCLSHRERLLELIGTRRTQTNEIGRGVGIVPGLRIAFLRSHQPLAVVEVGASAGLNLMFDRWRYRFSDGSGFGPADAEVTVDCEVVGTPGPPVAAGPVGAEWRLGLDLAPPDVSDPTDRLWLLACVFADQVDRSRRLAAALEIASADPPPVLAGDALDTLPVALGDVPDGLATVVVDTWVLTYLPRQSRRRFVALLEEASRQRPLWWLTGEAPGVVPGQPLREPSLALPGGGRDATDWSLAIVRGGSARWSPLAFSHPHGAWISWSAAGTQALPSWGWSPSIGGDGGHCS